MVGTVQFKKSFGLPASGSKTDCMRGSFGRCGRIPQPSHHQYECTATISEKFQKGTKIREYLLHFCFEWASYQNVPEQGGASQNLIPPEAFSFVGA
eukprot:2649863-Rhodomonas_salina.1